MDVSPSRGLAYTGHTSAVWLSSHGGDPALRWCGLLCSAVQWGLGCLCALLGSDLHLG